MPQPFVFTPAEISDPIELDAAETRDIEVIRRSAPQLAGWSDSQLADSWEEYSLDLRGVSWSRPSGTDSKQFLAYLLVKKLFPHVDAWAVGYEAFQQLGRDEPWVIWPEVKWPAWTSV